MQRLTHWIVHESWIAALELALVAAIAISLAYWTWAAVGPRALAQPSVSAGVGSAQGAAPQRRRLAGAGGERTQALEHTARGGALTLAGVFAAPSPDAGRALIAQGGGKPVMASVGESLGENLVLHEVHADHVIVLRGAAPVRLELERKHAGAAPARAGAAAQPPAATPARAPAATPTKSGT